MFKKPLDRLLLAVVLINLCAVIGGCHRSYYRRQADTEAQRLIREKSLDPRWSSADGTVLIDPQSRMFDPFSQDHPPIPPDDPTSHKFLHNVDDHEGYPHWHANGDTNAVENPDWRAYLPVNENGQVVLTLDGAFQLALIHSPDFQAQRETLYLSALDVSLQRFAFDSQLFSGFNTTFSTEGNLRPGSGGESASLLESSLGVGGGGINLQRMGITGANFAVNLANTILFNFAGDNTQAATTLLDFSIIQPLLRDAGRDRILEALTQSERTLLANVRQLERFRRGFYLLIATGRAPGAGPMLGGVFLASPVGASLASGGFFGLLEQQQTIRNQEFNVRQLEAVLERFREFNSRGLLSAIQLTQFENTLYGQQRALISARAIYETSLDAFKIDLGLPPELDVVIDDSYLDQFELISDQINERLITIGELRKETGRPLNIIEDMFADRESDDYSVPDELPERVKDLLPFIESAEELLEKVTTDDRQQLEEDFEKLADQKEERTEYLEQLTRDIASGRIASSVATEIVSPESLLDADDLRPLLSNPETDDVEIADEYLRDRPGLSVMKRAQLLKQSIEKTKAKVADFGDREMELETDELYKFIRFELQGRIPDQLAQLNNLLLEMSLLQAFTRSNAIGIIDVNITEDEAFKVATCMRRDLMNARASLVDVWRNIAFVADQLEAQLDLIFQGDVGNTGDNPFELNFETGQLQVGVQFDSPIVRQVERNDYRGALIAYQQARRDFYQFEDSVKQNIRLLIRNLERNKVLFELDRRTVQVQIRNVELNTLELSAPIDPSAPQSTTTARDLTDAIIGLNAAQDSYVGTWVQYEVLRRSLDFDIGTMQLDQLGAWIDPGKIDSTIGIRAAAAMGISLDCQFCQEVGVVSETLPVQPEFESNNSESEEDDFSNDTTDQKQTDSKTTDDEDSKPEKTEGLLSPDPSAPPLPTVIPESPRSPEPKKTPTNDGLQLNQPALRSGRPSFNSARRRNDQFGQRSVPAAGLPPKSVLADPRPLDLLGSSVQPAAVVAQRQPTVLEPFNVSQTSLEISKSEQARPEGRYPTTDASGGANPVFGPLKPINSRQPLGLQPLPPNRQNPENRVVPRLPAHSDSTQSIDFKIRPTTLGDALDRFRVGK